MAIYIERSIDIFDSMEKYYEKPQLTATHAIIIYNTKNSNHHFVFPGESKGHSLLLLKNVAFSSHCILTRNRNFFSAEIFTLLANYAL